ncbi:MAG: Na/Pi symporter [Candidatus Binatia bacterium]
MSRNEEFSPRHSTLAPRSLTDNEYFLRNNTSGWAGLVLARHSPSHRRSERPGGRFSAVASGSLFTALIQSSTAAILTVIGFVSAGLVTFSQAIGVIMGATLGTTSTPWLVAIFGFRVRIASAALPILGVGAFLWLVASGRTRSLGAILAGFGLLFTGIEYMQTGMEGVTWNFEAFTGPGSQWILAGIGIIMTIVLQSSSAAAATTLVALNAGSLTFAQGCALIVGLRKSAT